MLFCFLFVTRCQLGTSSPPGTAGCATFIFRFGFAFHLAPRHDGGQWEGFDVGFPCHGGQGNLATHTVVQDGMFLSYFLGCMLFSFLFVMRCQLGTSSPPGTVGCATFTVWFGFAFRLAPRHDGGQWEGFDVGFPCHSA